VQEIEVKSIRLEPSQAALARCNRAATCGVLRQNFADQKYLVTSPSDCLRYYSFGTAVRIHLGGVDQRHTELNAQPKRRNFFFRRRASTPMVHVPWPSTGRASPEDRQVTAIGPGIFDIAPSGCGWPMSDAVPVSLVSSVRFPGFD